jgi:hypothetical protein
MNQNFPISTEPQQIEDLPQPLSGALQEQLQEYEKVLQLVYKPRETMAMEQSPPKALAITPSAFVYAELVEADHCRVVRCEFDDVLLVELASMLLYGHLRIDYSQGTRRSMIAMEFNSVAHEIYRRAVKSILAGASNRITPWRELNPSVAVDFTNWPEPVRRAAEYMILSDRSSYRGTWWPSVRGGFAYELAPAGLVLSEGSRLTVITLEQSGPWDRVRSTPSFGIIATYLPADRIAKVGTHAGPELTIVELEMHARHGGERFRLVLPRDHESDVRVLLEELLSRSTT